MIRTRLHRPLLALALLPAAGGIALASTNVSHSADLPTAHVQMMRSTSVPVEAGDDSGGHGGRAKTTRAPEAGDDSGGHGGRTATRAPEPGDDSGGHGGGAGSGHGGSDDGPHHS